MSKTCIVWLRRDLRAHDNPALFKATKDYDKTIPVYIHDPSHGEHHKIGGASRWWLHNSLEALSKKIHISFASSSYLSELKKMIKESNADAVYINKSYDPALKELDESLSKELDVKIKFFDANLLIEPGSIKNNSDDPYKVFTPFWKSCVPKLNKFALAPDVSKKDTTELKNKTLDELDLLPKKPNWAKGMEERWKCGEDSAKSVFHKFMKNDIYEYKDGRNFPMKEKVSFMSPHLAFGEISVRYIYNYIQKNKPSNPSNSDRKNIEHYISELGWREFSYNLLYFFPHITHKNFKDNFDNFEWDKNSKYLTAWQKGQTGYPIVDAGMRELWHTGYIHNRVRMIVGSFLVKDLHINWTEGEQWFWDTLCDADIANNTASWQWVAGSGADAAPYFRIFNPILQGEKFDPDGEYVKKWVPELKDLDKQYIQKPFEAPPIFLQQAGVQLGKNYPRPIVDHKKERDVAMKKYEKVKAN